MSSISYCFTTLLMAMIVSCKTLVLHTFAKSFSKFREFFTPLRKRKVVLLTEEKQLELSDYNKSSEKVVSVTVMQKLVEKSKLSVSSLTTKIFSTLNAIFNSIWDFYAYILPRLVPSHIANLMSIAEAESQGKLSTYIL